MEHLKNPNNYTVVSNAVQPEWDDFFNCEVLACPEFDTFHHMINDTRYDYYSMYANPPRMLQALYAIRIPQDNNCQFQLIQPRPTPPVCQVLAFSFTTIVSPTILRPIRCVGAPCPTEARPERWPTLCRPNEPTPYRQ